MIRVRNLCKRYDDFQAVRSVDFDVEEGQIFGFIGPNGAGKTTTIRILATLDLPSLGVAEIGGYDVTEQPERVREIMGFMPDVWGVYPGLSVEEYLEFFAAAYGIERAGRARAVGDVMTLTDLSELSDKRVGTLSKGMKQRLCLAKTLIHDPKLLILDEPANGLDPRARIEFRALLRELASMGKTILISSHILTELSDLVTSVGIIERGRCLMHGDLQTILRQLEEGVDAAAESASRDPMEVWRQAREAEPEGEGEAPAAPLKPLQRFALRTTEAQREQARETLLARPEVRRARLTGAREVTFTYEGEEEFVAALVGDLVKAEVPVLGLKGMRMDLEGVFMAVTRGDVQ